MGWCFGGFGDVVRSGCECLRPQGLRVVRQMSDILRGDAIVLKVAQDYILILGIALDKENIYCYWSFYTKQFYSDVLLVNLVLQRRASRPSTLALREWRAQSAGTTLTSTLP